MFDQRVERLNVRQPSISPLCYDLQEVRLARTESHFIGQPKSPFLRCKPKLDPVEAFLFGCCSHPLSPRHLQIRHLDPVLENGFKSLDPRLQLILLEGFEMCIRDSLTSISSFGSSMMTSKAFLSGLLYPTLFRGATLLRPIRPPPGAILEHGSPYDHSSFSNIQVGRVARDGQIKRFRNHRARRSTGVMVVKNRKRISS